MGYSPLNNPYALTCTKCGLVCEEAVVSGESDCELLNGTRTLPRVTGTPPCTPSLTPRFGVVFGRVVEITCPDDTDGTLGEILYCVEEGGEAKYAHEVCCSCGEGSQISDLNAEITGYVCGVATFLSNLSGDISACCGGEEEPVVTECCEEATPRVLEVEVAALSGGGVSQPGCDACLGADSYPAPIDGTSITITYNDTTEKWEGSVSVCGVTLGATLECSNPGFANPFLLRLFVNGTEINNAALGTGGTFTCDPFYGETSQMQFSFAMSDCQEIIATVSEAI